MKVLHVIDRLETGGAENLFVTITSLLLNKNVTTGAMLFTGGSSLEKKLDKRLQLHILDRGNKFNPLTLYKAHKICSGYDIVHTHLRHVYAYIRLAQWLFNGKYKLIIHDHAAITDKTPLRLNGIFKPKHYIGVNSRQTEWAISTIGVDKENVFLLENTVAASPNTAPHTNIAKRAMIVANIRAVKNIEFAIELCKRMQWQLDIYGNIIEPEYYNRLIHQIGNDDSISIRQGVTDFSGIYNEYGLAIHCSTAETGPLVLLEYLAAGIPFIAYKTGSAAEAIAEELPQLFMNDFKYENWEQRISEILSDKELSEKMKALFDKKFNPEDYISKCLDIYQSVRS